MVNSLTELGHILGSGIKGKMGLDHGGCQLSSEATSF